MFNCLVGMGVVLPIGWFMFPTAGWPTIVIGSVLTVFVVYVLELAWFWLRRRRRSH